MAEYSRIAKGNVTSNGATQTINVPFTPDHIELWNYTAAGTPAQYGVPHAYWDVSMGQGYAIAEVFNATPVLTTQNFTTGGFSTFSAGLSLQYGTRQQIIGVTKANPASINVTAHGYVTGDVVILEGLAQSSTTGMNQMATIPFAVTRVDANNFTVVWNSNQTNYTALSGSPTGAYVKKVLYPWLYSPAVAIVSAITTGTTTSITTTVPHNFVVGQEVGFRIPTLWGTTELNTLPNVAIPGSPIYGFVTSKTATTAVVNINSTNFTAYTSNMTFAQAVGLSFPQVFAVGDVNTGGAAISSGSALYPPPQANATNTINGPAILGSYVNNTSAGFTIGSTAVSSAVLAGANLDVLYWVATASDYPQS